MHEAAITNNALAQLAQGVIPWTIEVPLGINPLSYYTSRHVGRALYGYTLSPGGVWQHSTSGQSETRTHLLHETGYVPELDRSTSYNRFLLLRDIERVGLHVMTRMPYRERAAAWYRGLTAFPKIYAQALEAVYIPDGPDGHWKEEQVQNRRREPRP